MAAMSFTAAELARLAGGLLSAGEASTPVCGCSLDSRTVPQGGLFVALRGEHADGHDFCGQAAAKGAAAVLVERDVELPPSVAVIRVPSVEQAFRVLGAAARKLFQGTVVGVVGSCGKTTTKEFTAEVLRQAGPVSATAGNRNNLLGVPETILNADLGAKFWVLELGISTPGEMADLAPIASPDAVVFTTIQPVHLEFFPSVAEIAEEKAKVLRWTRGGGFAVINGDDPLLFGVALPAGLHRITYGRSAGVDLYLETGAEVSAAGIPLALTWKGNRVQCFLPVAGDHQAMNFAAACAVGLSCGLSLEESASASPRLRPAKHRGELKELACGALLLDDSYNANPAAVKAVLASAAKWGRRTVAVLGEMRELGPESERFHAEVGAVASSTVTALAAVGGTGARAMATAFGSSGRESVYAPRWEEIRPWVSERLLPGDLLVVKGSRAVGLDGLADALAGEA